MNWFSGIVVFVIIWWMVFFCMLPVGIRHAEQNDQGHMPGAPLNPDVKKKLLWTTLVTLPFFAGMMWLINSGLITFKP